MLDRERVETLLDLQRRSYALLRWIDARVQSGTLPLDSLHGALDAASAAAEWLSRHAASLPEDARPPEDKLAEFAHLFASYLVTSFEIRTTKKVRAACGCELCAYLVGVSNLKARPPSAVDREIANELKLDCLEALATEASVPLFRDELASFLRSSTDLERPLAVVTYVRELGRRSAFRGQGRPVLALWREFAWKDRRPIKNFELRADNVLEAEASIRSRLARLPPDAAQHAGRDCAPMVACYPSSVDRHHPKGLAPIDPLAVPLPHGTEVTTRVDRLVGERRVPQGVVGRVVAIRNDGFDVLVTGVGVLRYARDEILPRRPGQVRFAEQRAVDWDSLRRCVVLEATVGSRAWGLADEGSDTDLRGIFALPLPWTTGLLDAPTTLTSADGSTTYWEHRKAVHQAIRADPNTLELLFVPTARAKDVIGEWLLEERDAFVSADLFGSFGRYAVSQLGKLARSARLAEHRGLVLDWLKSDPPPDLDEVARRLATISPRPHRSAGDALLAAKEYVKQLYRSLFDQGLLDANEFPALVRYARSGGKQPEPARELRPKNAYNLLRLIHVATGWLRTGRPELEMKGAARERLLAIKRGDIDLDAVLREAESLVPALEEARDATPLPKRPDLSRADALLRRIGEEIARRWISREPGPLGADAPQPPPTREVAP